MILEGQVLPRDFDRKVRHSVSKGIQSANHFTCS
jgi:hypothetical protein